MTIKTYSLANLSLRVATVNAQYKVSSAVGTIAGRRIASVSSSDSPLRQRNGQTSSGRKIMLVAAGWFRYPGVTA